MKVSDVLTTEQKSEIRDRALEMAYEDAQHSEDYLYSIIEKWVDSHSASGQIDIITSDEDIIREMITFDPRTGESWKNEE